MRRLYIAPKSVWFAAAHASLFHPGIGSHYIDLPATGEPVTTHAEAHALLLAEGHSLEGHENAHAAFRAHEGVGSSHVLMSTSFASETTEEAWHWHPSVAILPHPAFEGNDTIVQHVGSVTKKLAQHHVDKLTAHPTLGFVETDSILMLSRKSASLHPQVKLRPIL